MNQNELNDAFYAAREGDNDAFQKLFDAFWDMAYYSCLKYLHHEHDAEDAVQEIFIILHRRIKKMKGPEFLAKGIQYYTLEVCSGYKNRKKISPELITSLEELQDYSYVQKEEFLPEVVLERKELKEQILKLVNNLPHKQREVLFNYYFNDFSAKEIAKLLNININAVGFNLHKARQKLTALVNEKTGPQKNLKLAATPVMTQLFQEEMLQVTTPEIKQHSEVL